MKNFFALYKSALAYLAFGLIINLLLFLLCGFCPYSLSAFVVSLAAFGKLSGKAAVLLALSLCLSALQSFYIGIGFLSGLSLILLLSEIILRLYAASLTEKYFFVTALSSLAPALRIFLTYRQLLQI